ncbi:pentapeptide repeat-containing protein [Gemmata sp. JC717]|uniref:pentapeptide repeat-containing protein n=1 Tax=Gemmata algarum TaxID=2975278 RepID=UPI0021BA99E5|nr:pentapeptide repeat-containing protein [Gemmata algarum]MDY3554779.1 pentapeptide repeat-containing protein [Gemmata algarum]
MLTTTHPTSPWFKPVKFNARQLFTTLGKGLVNFASGNWSQVGMNAVELVGTIDVQASPGERAWMLIQRAMVKAIHELTREVRRLIDLNRVPNYEDVGRSLEDRLDTLPVEVTNTFLEQPKKEPFVGEMVKVYEEWLRALGLSIEYAQSESKRLPGYFVYALREEARRNASDYAPVFQSLSGPFAKAADREAKWNVYRAWLQRQVDQPVFDEPFSLRQIFIPLRGYYKLNPAISGPRNAEAPTQSPAHRAVWLRDELEQWRGAGDPNYALRLLSGDPGSGKSSFAKMYADHLAEAGVNVIYVPLQLFKWKDDLTDALGEFCQRDEYLPEGVCHAKTGEPELFLIFDGLDELAKQGRAGEEAAQQFVREVRNLLTERNRETVRVKVLICGRPLSIQSIEGELRKPGQVLYVARYLVSETEHAQFDNSGLFREDQRIRWWVTFGELTGLKYTKLPDELASGKLNDVTAQPLLNYLVALAYRRKKLDFSGEVNLNGVYADLLEAVYARGYERGENPRHRSAQLMSLDEFKRVMQQVGIAAWHGNTRTTTAEAIEKRCMDAGLGELLDKFREGAKLGVSRLLLAFYFQEHNPSGIGERSFEFTHKSFGEYLTAVGIVNALSDIQDEMDRRRAKPGKGWDAREALRHWVTICGPTALDLDYFAFIADEIKFRIAHTPGEPKKWRATLVTLLDHVIQYGLPLELLGPDRPETFRAEQDHARKAEEALLALHCACAEATGETSTLSIDGSTLGTWVRTLSGRFDPSAPIVVRCLARISLRGAYLSFSVLNDANLQGIDLSESMIEMSYVGRSDISYANLTETILTGTVIDATEAYRSLFTMSHIDNLQLEFSNLNESDFTFCTGNRVDFFGTLCVGTKFRGAKLPEANFRHANLTNADLRYVDLRYAEFDGAILTGADLRGADLQNARITNDQLQSAKYRPADEDPDREDIQKSIDKNNKIRKWFFSARIDQLSSR